MTAPVDSLGFAEAIRNLPEQLALARKLAADVDLKSAGDATDQIDNVVVCGMGGSGVSGDVLAAVGAPVMRVPVTVVKGYELPMFVGPRSLVFVVSYSGGTEESIAATNAAIEAQARLVAVCSDGALGELATKAGAAVASCPEGLMPRAAIGALVAPILITLERVGLLEGAGGWIDASVAQLIRRREQCHPEILDTRNMARELARKIGRTIPLTYGGGAIGGVAAMRWKADFNENAKVPAFWNAYPELDHNELCGWGQHGDITRQVFSLVELRHDFEHSQVRRRFEITRSIISETLAQVLSVEAVGEGRLAQLLDLVYVGCWVSVYLALNEGVDPGPVDAIMRLKYELGKEEAP